MHVVLGALRLLEFVKVCQQSRQIICEPMGHELSTQLPHRGMRGKASVRMEPLRIDDATLIAK